MVYNETAACHDSSVRQSLLHKIQALLQGIFFSLSLFLFWFSVSTQNPAIKASSFSRHMPTATISVKRVLNFFLNNLTHSNMLIFTARYGGTELLR